jgi:hypothetical protein
MVPRQTKSRLSYRVATARPRQAGTSFGSQPQQGGRRIESQANRDLSTLRPDSTAIPARPVPSTESLNWAVI